MKSKKAIKEALSNKELRDYKFKKMNEKWDGTFERKKIIDREQFGKLQDLYEKMNDNGLILSSSTSIPVINLKKDVRSDVRGTDLEDGYINKTMLTQPDEPYFSSVFKQREMAVGVSNRSIYQSQQHISVMRKVENEQVGQ